MSSEQQGLVGMTVLMQAGIWNASFLDTLRSSQKYTALSLTLRDQLTVQNLLCFVCYVCNNLF